MEVTEKESSQSLGEIFSDKTPRDAKPSVAKETKDETKAEPKPEVKPDDKITEVKPETKQEVKADGNQKEITKETSKEKDKVLKTEEKKPDAKVEEKPSVNWDDEANPYKKQKFDTQNWANKVNQENIAIKQQLEIVNKKLDGTYDPAKDEITVSPDQDKANAELSGRVAASLAAAHEMHGGEEKVRKMLSEFYDKHGGNQYMMNRIWSAPMPAIEAIKIMNEQAFQSKYGKDPDAIYKSIKSETEAEMRERIREEVTKEFNERLSLKDKQPSGLSDVKGATVTHEEKDSDHTPLNQLFRH